MSTDRSTYKCKTKFTEATDATLDFIWFCVDVCLPLSFNFLHENHGYIWRGFSDDEMPHLFISSKHEIRVHKVNHTFSAFLFQLVHSFIRLHRCDYLGRFQLFHFQFCCFARLFHFCWSIWSTSFVCCHHFPIIIQKFSVFVMQFVPVWILNSCAFKFKCFLFAWFRCLHFFIRFIFQDDTLHTRN